jgi:hypothetical protein
VRIHFDVLGWLHALGGAFGVVTGLSLLVLAGGTFLARVAIPEATAASDVVWLLGAAGVLLGGAGASMIFAGRALLARRSGGRSAALWVAAVNLCILPFGTALGIYTVWALLNDDARHAFGRGPRASSNRP